MKLLLIFVAIALVGCATPYAAGRASCDIVQAANDIAGGQVANCDRSKASCKRAQEVWPVVNASVTGALTAARAAIDIAERVKAGDRAWLPHLKAAVCALSRALGGVLKAVLPRGGAEAASVLALVGAGTCDR